MSTSGRRVDAGEHAAAAAAATTGLAASRVHLMPPAGGPSTSHLTESPASDQPLAQCFPNNDDVNQMQ